jgi:alkylation response protein AidB-like acyl-CoA dehydrogenase
VDGASEGLSFGAQERKLGWNSQPTAQVFFENVRVPAHNLLGGEEGVGKGFKMAMTGLDGGRLSIGTCSIGAAQRCFDIAREHVMVRNQFGAPLSDNQSVQFKLADMATGIQTSRTLLRQAAGLLDEGHPQKTAFCAMAKRVATDTGFEVCNEALQLMGGCVWGGGEDCTCDRAICSAVCLYVGACMYALCVRLYAVRLVGCACAAV